MGAARHRVTAGRHLGAGRLGRLTQDFWVYDCALHGGPCNDGPTCDNYDEECECCLDPLDGIGDGGIDNTKNATEVTLGAKDAVFNQTNGGVNFDNFFGLGAINLLVGSHTQIYSENRNKHNDAISKNHAPVMNISHNLGYARYREGMKVHDPMPNATYEKVKQVIGTTPAMSMGKNSDRIASLQTNSNSGGIDFTHDNIKTFIDESTPSDLARKGFYNNDPRTPINNHKTDPKANQALFQGHNIIDRPTQRSGIDNDPCDPCPSVCVRCCAESGNQCIQECGMCPYDQDADCPCNAAAVAGCGCCPVADPCDFTCECWDGSECECVVEYDDEGCPISAGCSDCCPDQCDPDACECGCADATSCNPGPDECGVCGGDGPEECPECGGNCACPGEGGCSGCETEDDCGVCGGDGPQPCPECGGSQCNSEDCNSEKDCGECPDVCPPNVCLEKDCNQVCGGEGCDGVVNCCDPPDGTACIPCCDCPDETTLVLDGSSKLTKMEGNYRGKDLVPIAFFRHDLNMGLSSSDPSAVGPRDTVMSCMLELTVKDVYGRLPHTGATPYVKPLKLSVYKSKKDIAVSEVSCSNSASGTSWTDNSSSRHASDRELVESSSVTVDTTVTPLNKIYINLTDLARDAARNNDGVINFIIEASEWFDGSEGLKAGTKTREPAMLLEFYRDGVHKPRIRTNIQTAPTRPVHQTLNPAVMRRRAITAGL